jgi:GNAT superfamily N-acetyltransferase
MTRTANPDTGSPPPRVIRAGRADLDALSQVIADAFHPLPPSRWLIADPAARRVIFPGYFRLYVEHAMAYGAVCTTPSRDAVALWLPAGGDDPGLPAGYQARLATATAPWTSRFLAFDQALDRNHPAQIPHQHLAILAVRPGRQGQGTGAALLRAQHQILDRDGTPAYLEAADQRSCRLYERQGYVLLPGTPFRLPDGGPAMWQMWREPHQTLPRRDPKPARPKRAAIRSDRDEH